jgi:hypothetical protein
VLGRESTHLVFLGTQERRGLRHGRIVEGGHDKWESELGSDVGDNVNDGVRGEAASIRESERQWRKAEPDVGGVVTGGNEGRGGRQSPTWCFGGRFFFLRRNWIGDYSQNKYVFVGRCNHKIENHHWMRIKISRMIACTLV